MSNITKEALEESLFKLLKTKALDKITVTEISENVGINRMTFYYHFKDIYDLVEWSFIQQADKVVKSKKTYQTWKEGYKEIYIWALDNKDVVLNIYNSISREHLEKYLFEITFNFLYGVVEEKSKAYKLREEDKIFMANFYKYSFVGLLLDFIRGGMRENPETLIEKVNTMIEGTLENAANRFNIGL